MNPRAICVGVGCAVFAFLTYEEVFSPVGIGKSVMSYRQTVQKVRVPPTSSRAPAGEESSTASTGSLLTDSSATHDLLFSWPMRSMPSTAPSVLSNWSSSSEEKSISSSSPGSPDPRNGSLVIQREQEGDTVETSVKTPAFAAGTPRQSSIEEAWNPSSASDPTGVIPLEKSIPALNLLVLDAIREMPTGGEYRTTPDAFSSLRESISLENGRLQVKPRAAKPSFCSAATYLVFLSVIAKLNAEGRLSLKPQAMQQFLVRGQADGVGVWGRWNANGPGTARLFYTLRIGRNFTALEQAKPGDFMKIFWTKSIGSTEFGHSVIFLGLERGQTGEEFVSFWSSNKPGGYGYKRVPRNKIKRYLFSRLEDPQALSRVTELPPRDGYLAAMLKRQSDEREMFNMVGVSAKAGQ